MRKKIFISYCREKKSLVYKVYKDIVYIIRQNNLDIETLIDENEVLVSDNFREFMNKIEFCDYALMIISKSYLVSRYCMIEAFNFFKKIDYEKGILILICDDIKFDNIFKTNEIINYWKDSNKKHNKLNKKNPQYNDKILNDYRNIAGFIEIFLTKISETRCLNLKRIINGNYKEVFKKIAPEFEFPIVIQRYDSFLEENESYRDIIQKMMLFLSASLIPIPIRILQSFYGEKVFAFVEKLCNRKVLSQEKFADSEQVGIQLNDQSILERLKSDHKDEWPEMNKKVADSLVANIDQNILSKYYKQLAQSYRFGNDSVSEYKFLFQHFKESVIMQNNIEVIESGNRCLELIDELSTKSPLVYVQDKSEIFLKIGITYNMLREFDKMEKVFVKYKETAIFDNIEIKKHILKIYRTSAKINSKPQIVTKEFPGIKSSLDFLKVYLNKDSAENNCSQEKIEIVRAVLHGLNHCHLYFKKFHGNYEEASSYIEEAITLSSKYELKNDLLWSIKNRGTLMLYQDENYRNRLDFSSILKIWEDTLNYWSPIHKEAQREKTIEHMIEMFCAVGFIKMFMGFKSRNNDFCEDSEIFFRQADKLAGDFNHPFWLCKINNHRGIHETLSGDINEAQRFFQKGIEMCEKISNNYTIWMLYQNIANIAFLNENEEELEINWKNAFKLAIDGYFMDTAIAIKNYNFRLLLRGFILHSIKYPELGSILNKYPDLTDLIEKDSGLTAFHQYCSCPPQEKSIADIYAFDGCYYNTH